jgi:hypothetical protein
LSAGTIAVKGDPKRSLPGNLGANITLSAAAKGAALQTLQVAGTMGAAITAAAGSVGNVTAGDWTSGSLTAESAGNVIIKGSLIGVSLTLTEPTTASRTATALGRLNVTGRMADSMVNSAGNIGTVSVGAMESSQLCAGLAAPTQGMPQTRGDFAPGPDNALPRIKSVAVYGMGGQTASFQNSIIAAWEIGAVRLQDVQFDTPDGAAWFGVSANGLRSYRRQSGKALGYAWTPAAPLAWPADDQQDFHVVHVVA